MMNQGGTAEHALQPNNNPLEVSLNQGHTLQYYPTNNGPAPGTWPAYGTESHSMQSGNVTNLSYPYQQNTQKDVQPNSAHGGSGATPAAFASSSLGSDSTSQAYSNYPSYSNPTNAYEYANSAYSGPYSGYQQQPSTQTSQPVGAYQNTGAPYQPISSFQHTASYPGSSGYSSTYYNPGDYQTSGAYTGSGYNNSTNSWDQGNHSSYTQQYANFSHDTNSAYGSSSVAAIPPVDYQQQYKQWADYYSQIDVPCPPGTEKIATSVASTSASPYSSSVSSTNSCTPSVSQAHPSYVPAWIPEPALSASPSVQTVQAVGTHDSYWRPQNFQNHHVSGSQQSFQNPLCANPATVHAQQQQLMPQAHVPSYARAPQFTEPNRQPFALPPPPPPPAPDTRRVSKMQIPTNPRIASNLALSLSKTDKDSSTAASAVKPAYVSVPVPKPNDKVISRDPSNYILKPGAFPPSLRGYVERVLARCKDERQMIACQEIMKELISKATADGTLQTRNWDTEPLFPLPDTAPETSQGTVPAALLPTFKRSPNSRRTKSRWEPMPEEKPVDKFTHNSLETAKYTVGAHFDGREKKFNTWRAESKDVGHGKFPSFQQVGTSKSAQRSAKRQRYNERNTENGDASSDSDNERGLTPSFSGAMAFADTPEERKRRESRSKRFERGTGQRGRANSNGPKNKGAGNLYARRATALVLSKVLEDNNSRAVEDIDWDSLTVKGTCQEIEKRYLRLTSAPDPATVRPEEVLEQALLMVQNTPKNYLYKCDQLKSIRQDLTVQRINNELTVKVYETHARLALEYGDLPEFNQCQSQLKSLYGEGICGCNMEFLAYNLLYVSLRASNTRELLSSMSRLSDEAKRDDAVKHALAVRAAVKAGNYVLFMRLYKTAINLNACLMDLHIEKLRYEAVKCMSRAYRPTVPVAYIARVLGFSCGTDEDTTDGDGMEECSEWLKAHGACLISDNSSEMQLDAKASASTLYMPEPEDAVAHGDANLAVNDFFTRTAS